MSSKSTIKVQIEAILKGRENVPGLKKDLKALEATVRQVKRSMDFTSVIVGFSALKSSIQSVADTVHDLCGAYAMQIEAETKLATNMRNTMAAREADIQSIKELCAAQQELGVIGDEVQLAGAQELATYLSEKQSLEQLIPVMNDMLAQQYGLSASQENAAQIATMLGKVMEGQTGALKRYGYSFDEAQEQILKFGNESQRAAVLCDVIRSTVGGMNAELAKTDAGKQKQMANALGDIKEKAGKILQATEQWVSLGAAVMTSIAAIGQFGASVTAIRSFTKAVYGAVVASKALNVVMFLGSGSFEKAKAAVLAFRTAEKGTIAYTNALNTAIRGLVVSTGIGIAITALSIIIGRLCSSADEATDSTNKFISAEERAKREAEQLEQMRRQEASTLNSTRAALEINIAKLKDFNGTKEQEKKLVGEMNDIYGDTMGYFSSVADWYKALVANSEAYCRQMVIEARTRMLANQIAEKEQENYNTLYDETGNPRRFSTEIKGYKKVKLEDIHSGTAPNLRDSAITDKSEAIDQVNANNRVIANYKKQMESLVKESAGLNFDVKGSATRPDSGKGSGIEKQKTRLQELSDLIEKAKERYVNASETERGEIRKNIAAWNEEKAAIENLYKEAEQPLEMGQIPILQEKARKLREELAKAVDLDLAAMINLELEKVDRQISHWQNYKGSANTELTIDTDATKLLPALDGTMQLQEKTDLAAQAQERLQKQMEQVSGSASNVGSVFYSLGEAIGGAIGSIMEWAATTINAIAQVIPQITTLIAAKQGEAIAGATASGSTLPPPLNIISIAAGVAAVLAQFAKIPKFATGGIAFGPTLGLFGEYAGASNNPEVVAPLDKLRDLIGPQPALAGEVRFIIEGDKLVGILDRRRRRSSRT